MGGMEAIQTSRPPIRRSSQWQVEFITSRTISIVSSTSFR